tara:strand:- start:4066 stop:4833 length:768 start_codon:yes stop_codon:yes gene_type:complete
LFKDQIRDKAELLIEIAKMMQESPATWKNKKMNKLDELLPIEVYAKTNKISVKEVIGLGIIGRLNIFYVFDGPSLVIYEPVSDSYKALGTKNNMVADDGCIEIEYLAPDVIKIAKLPLNLLYTNNQTELINLIKANTPEGFMFDRMLDGAGRIVDVNKVFITTELVSQTPTHSAKQELQAFSDRPTQTSLKVISLLMLHLAKSPKYALGDQPNKSQIKELLLDLASEFNIKEYGLSKVDERLLKDAMKYLETQTN